MEVSDDEDVASPLDGSYGFSSGDGSGSGVTFEDFGHDFGAQLASLCDFGVLRHASCVLEVAAVFGTGFLGAAVVVRCSVWFVEAAVDGEVVSDFFVLPDHVWPVEQYVEDDVFGDTAESCIFIGFDGSVSVGFALVLHAFFVVAFAVTNISVFVGICERVVGEPSHSSLAIGIGYVLPAEHTSVDELRAFAAHVSAPVFEDEVSIGGNGFDAFFVVVFEVFDGCVSDGVAESVAEIESVSVHFVFSQPIL